MTLHHWNASLSGNFYIMCWYAMALPCRSGKKSTLWFTTALMVCKRNVSGDCKIDFIVCLNGQSEELYPKEFMKRYEPLLSLVYSATSVRPHKWVDDNKFVTLA